MADFDTNVALQAKGYSPQDAVAPLQAYLLGQQGRNLGAEATGRDLSNTQNQLALLGRQQLAGALKAPGATPLSALNASGLGVYDPDTAKTILGNLQTSNTIGAFKSFGDTHDPYSLAPAGPEAVGQGATALGTQASTAETQQRVAGQRQEQLGMLGSSFLQSDQSEGARQAILARAHDMSLFIDPVSGQFNNLLYHSFRTMPLQEFAARARQFAAAGTASAQTSGLAVGAQKAAEFPYDHFSSPVTDTTYMGSAWRDGPPPPGGFADPAPTSGAAPPPSQGPMGRSVAADGTVPVAPAPGNGSRPVSGGFTGAPPAAAAQPAMMTQAEQAFRLPAGYLGRTSQLESSGRSDASNGASKGLFGFMPSTWTKYAQPGQNPFDPQASTVAAARLASDNMAQLTRVLGRPPTGAELYLAHQQGAAGAAGLLTNPNAPAASIVGAKAVISNGGTPNMTAGEFAAMWERKFNGQGGGNFSLSGPSPMGQGVSMPAIPPPAAAAPAGAPVAAAAPLPPPPTQPDLAPPVSPGPIPLLSSTVSMPSPSNEGSGRSAAASVPPTAPLMRVNPNAPVVLQHGLTPFELQKQQLDAGRAVNEEESARNQFISANDAQRGLMQLQEDLTKLTPAPGANLRDTLLAPGSGADTRIGLAKTVNSLLTASGGSPLFDPDKITAAESAQKTSGRLGFDLAGGLGKGEAGYIVNQAIGLNPSVLSTPQGAKLLIGSLMATQQRQKDLYLFQGEYARANKGNPIGAETMFDENRPPMSYVQDAQRLARVPLPAVKYLQAHGHDQQTISEFNQTYGPSLARYYLGSRTD